MPILKIKDLMSFQLPPDWQGEENDYTYAIEQATPPTGLGGALNPQSEAAIIEFLQKTSKDELAAIEEWPAQFDACPTWNDEQTHASISITANIVSYSTKALQKAESFLASNHEISLQDIVGNKQQRLFTTWYTNWERSQQEFDIHMAEQSLFNQTPTHHANPTPTHNSASTPAQDAKDAALLEGYFELKALAARSSLDQNHHASQTEDFRIIRATTTDLKGRRAAMVESEVYRNSTTYTQTGYHLLSGKSKELLWHVCQPCRDTYGGILQGCQHKARWPLTLRESPPAEPFYWHVTELHIFLLSSLSASTYIQPEFNSFLASIAYRSGEPDSWSPVARH